MASTVFGHLDKYGTGIHVYDGKKPLPTARYGSCRVNKGALWTKRGKLVAHINCGLSVAGRGLVDHLGLGVGAWGSQVIAREHKPGKGLICVARGTKTTCWYVPKDDSTEPWVTYTVKAKIKGQAVRGKAAERFFAKQRVSSFHVTMYCH